MAQNVQIAGASYTDVPSINIPKVGGGNATFYDVQGGQDVTANGTYDVTTKASVTVNIPQGIPIEVSTDAGMTAVLTSENVGKSYKFTGTTGTYVNGDIYVVEAN